MRRLNSISGLTLVEVLVAATLAGMISIAALRFYSSEHNNMITQRCISDLQQNLRASLDEIARKAKNAGANLPDGMQSICTSDTNPDTLEILFAVPGGSIEVGDHTSRQAGQPIRAAKGSDISHFSVDQVAYLWHTGLSQGESFTITSIIDNVGSGWQEIHHDGDSLMTDPVPGDVIIALNQFKYYLSLADTTHPLLMRATNRDSAEIYADNIYDLQFRYYLANDDTVAAVGPGDSVFVINIAMSSQSEQMSYAAERFGHESRRRWNLTTDVVLRNNRF